MQNNRCNHCHRLLDVVNFDHIDGNRANNSFYNCQALCPNCHRAIHLGNRDEKVKRLKILYNKNIQNLVNCRIEINLDELYKLYDI